MPKHAQSTPSVHRLSRLERSALVVTSIRQRLWPRRILVAGPYTGEFGYELRFQGFVRALRPRYDKVYVLTYPGREIFYPGCTVIVHDIPLEKAGYGPTGRLGPRDHRAMARALLPDLSPWRYDLFVPAVMGIKVWNRPLWRPRQEVISAPFRPEDRTDLLLHFRAVEKEGWDRRPNFTGAQADALWRACVDLDLKCGCIGHPRYSYCPPGCADFRSERLDETVAKISATRLVVGQQSGGVHLANYCGKPSVIWAATPQIVANGLRMNPHKVRIDVVTDTTWVPPVERVAEKIRAVLPTCAAVEISGRAVGAN